MPTIPLKRQSGGGGRLRRLLESLRPPARAGPLPVQTGFPTSLADIVVKNHGRLRNPRRRHRAAGPPDASAAAAEPAPVSGERRELSVAHDAAAPGPAPAPVPARGGKGARFSIQPGLLAASGAVTLVLLVIWSKQVVAAATLASVALSWIESTRRTVRPRRRPETEEEEEADSSRDRVSQFRDEAAESPRPGCGECGSNDGGNDAASVRSADSCDLGRVDKVKQRRRGSLRKLLASKLRNGGKTTPRATDSSHGGEEGYHPGADEANAEPATAPAAAGAAAEAPPAEAITDDDRCQRNGRRRGSTALPLPVLVPVILAGLVAGKLPALALAVLCAVFSSSVERLPAPARASGGDLSLR